MICQACGGGTTNLLNLGGAVGYLAPVSCDKVFRWVGGWAGGRAGGLAGGRAGGHSLLQLGRLSCAWFWQPVVPTDSLRLVS